jgi:DNA topoisomerase-2
MFMTDQDHDGSHIKGLLINFVHELWPSLVRRPGFLCQFRTPLLKARRHGEAKWTLEFFSQNEYEEWRLALPADAKFDVKWYKGLGTR